MDFIKENKKFIVIASSVIVAIVVGIVAFYLLQKNDTAIEEEAPNTSFVKNNFFIPTANEVSNQPYLYDFINGSIGMSTDGIDMVNDSIFEIVTKPDSSKLYLAYKTGTSGSNNINLYLPVFSSKPVQYYTQSEYELSTFNSEINKYIGNGQVEKHEDNGYIVYVFREDYSLLGNDFNFCGINLKDNLLDKVEEGDMQQTINNGEGYPTSLIRKICDLNAIKQVSGIDFNDTFWNDVNYGSRIKCFKKSSSKEYCVLSPISTSIISNGDKIYTYSVNNIEFQFSVDEVSGFLQDAGYETIESALNNKIYCSENDFKTLDGKSF